MRVLIVGCGYVGVPLGAELVRQGHEVYGVRRSPDAEQVLKDAGIHPLVADVTKPSDLQKLPCGLDWVVNLVSSSKGGAAEYRAVFVEGMRNLIDWLAPNPPKKFIYTSSTSVYGQTDGSNVKENSPTEPLAETSQALVETERILLAGFESRKLPAVVLRVAGIYGPERGQLFQRYLKHEAKIVGQGERFINMIHRDDLIAIIVMTLRDARPGEIYNVVDDEPVTQFHFFQWLAEELGEPIPPSVPEGSDASGKRGSTNKRVLNRKLKMELGYQFKYPNYRQGYTAEIQRLQNSESFGFSDY